MTAWKDRFNEPTLNLLRLLGEHTTYKLLKRAHPEITDEQIRDAELEVLKALELKNASSRDAMLQTFEVAKELLKEENAHLPSPEGAYQLRISLMGSSPEIWRRFVVPGDITLETLHYVIQDVMGWQECHLHRFSIDGEDYMANGEGGMGDEIDAHDETEHHLHHLVKREKARFQYEYDFGDGWEHLLVVEKILPLRENPATFLCLGGERSCPPEDCGGIPGYERMLEVLKDKHHEEYTDTRRWIGGRFDSERFDVEGVNRALAKFKPKARKR